MMDTPFTVFGIDRDRIVMRYSVPNFESMITLNSSIYSMFSFDELRNDSHSSI